jgi:hypothetical protein
MSPASAGAVGYTHPCSSQDGAHEFRVVGGCPLCRAFRTPTVLSPDGFEAVQVEYGPDFQCRTCRIAVDPSWHHKRDDLTPARARMLQSCGHRGLLLHDVGPYLIVNIAYSDEKMPCAKRPGSDAG